MARTITKTALIPFTLSKQFRTFSVPTDLNWSSAVESISVQATSSFSRDEFRCVTMLSTDFLVIEVKLNFSSVILLHLLINVSTCPSLRFLLWLRSTFRILGVRLYAMAAKSALSWSHGPVLEKLSSTNSTHLLNNFWIAFVGFGYIIQIANY